MKNNLKLDADTTIYAKKIDGVMTKVDKPETITEVKDVNAYGKYASYIDNIERQEPEKLVMFMGPEMKKAFDQAFKDAVWKLHELKEPKDENKD